MKQRAWPIYRRLLAYVLRYKFRLAVSLFFSFVVALSFTSMIGGAGYALRIVIDKDHSKVDTQVEKFAKGAQAFVDDPLSVFTGGDGESEDNGEAAPGVEAENPGAVYDWVTGTVRGMRVDQAQALAVLALFLVCLSLVGGVARYFQEYYANAIGARVTVEINEDMFKNMVHLSHRFFEGHTTGEIVARFTNDSFVVSRGLVNVLIKLTREPIKLALLIVLALLIDVFLTLVVLLVFAPIVFLLITVGKRVKKSVRRSLQKIAVMASVITETAGGIAVIKSFRMERYERDRIGRELRTMRRHLLRMARADAAIAPGTEFLMILGLAAFVMLSRGRVDAGLESGELFILFGLLAAMLDPLRKLATVNNAVQRSVASGERVFEFIDMKPDVVERVEPVQMGRLKESLRFDEVHFSYDGEAEALRGVTFSIGAGEMVALVGFSGGGKSTIAKLTPRFYDPTQGRITIDGLNIRDVSFADLRDQIGIVTQDTVLFQDTVAGNIAYGQTGFSDEAIRDAAQAANALDFIEDLPQSFDTMLDESGGNLSGGQRQRIAIARAIIKDPSILILDEATSNLDSESEQAIQQALSELVVGRATLVIAHRLSTIQQADKIVVIDEGRIAQEGTHAELLSRGGIYRRLHELQFPADRDTKAE